MGSAASMWALHFKLHPQGMALPPPNFPTRAPFLDLFVRLLHSRTEFLFMNIHFTRVAVFMCV